MDFGIGAVYLLRLGGIFGHPADHIIGIACWSALAALYVLRCAWEAQKGHFPARWGPFLALCVVTAATIGALAEISVATQPGHAANQASQMFR